ncbi:2269_t:CDS:1, partial [Diversispora eburnea]
AAEKLTIIADAKALSCRAAARKHGVDHSMVSRWINNEEKIKNAPKKNKSIGSGKKSQYPKVEKILKQWILEHRQNAVAATCDIIKMHMLTLLSNDFAETYPGADSKFHATDMWLFQFMKRNNFALRRKTKISQKLPEDLADKIISFQKFIINHRNLYNYNLSHIGNMDETPIFFDMVQNQTIDTRRSKTVNVRTTSNEKNRFTCVLTILADGTKLAPFVIFKGQCLPKNLPDGIVVIMHSKGWMDEAGMNVWFEKIWSKRPGGLAYKKERALLVLYSFEGHKTENVKKKAREENTDLCVIPGELTSTVQPLDVCINKPFKDRLRKKWDNWMIQGNYNFTKLGNIKKPGYNTMCEWIIEAWNDIPSEMVSKSFKKCGISNAMDGTEDDLIWEENNENNNNDESADEDPGILVDESCDD